MHPARPFPFAPRRPKPSDLPRWLMCALCSVALAWLAGVPLQARAQVAEPDLKAAFVFNFAVFTEWPADVLRKGSPMVLCSYAGNSLQVALASLHDKTVNGHRLAVRQLGTAQASGSGTGAGAGTSTSTGAGTGIGAGTGTGTGAGAGRGTGSGTGAGAGARGCHILFLDGQDRERWNQLRKELAGTAVLTVADDRAIGSDGAVIVLDAEQRRIGFVVDLNAARLARLTLSSKLLHLARSVQ